MGLLQFSWQVTLLQEAEKQISDHQDLLGKELADNM